MAKQRSITSNLGLYVYGGAAIFVLLFGICPISFGNAICIALAGASWVVSDSINATAKTKPIPAESPGKVSIPA